MSARNQHSRSPPLDSAPGRAAARKSTPKKGDIR
jgi:hypothetical protein